MILIFNELEKDKIAKEVYLQHVKGGQHNVEETEASEDSQIRREK
jgi:hypothetical protein